jgi:hypothetical protein
MSRIKTLHGETNVPDWLKSIVRKKSKRVWVPFPALKVGLIGTPEDFLRLIRDIVGRKLMGQVEIPTSRLTAPDGSFTDTLKAISRRKRFAKQRKM